MYLQSTLFLLKTQKNEEGQSEQANLMKTAIEHWHCLFTCHYDGKL